MIKKVLQIHLLISLVAVALVSVLDAPHNALGVGVGATVIAANLVGLIFAWERIFLKKSIALATSAIVFKYAILGTIIYLILTKGNLQASGFVIGLTTLLPTIVLFALTSGKNMVLKETAE